MPSRGWHGEAYLGHIFWDELLTFPLLNLRIPDIPRAPLKYRQRRLDAARHAGCRSRRSLAERQRPGEETQLVHLNPKSGRWLPDHSHLHRHVNDAFVYNLWHCYQVSGDLKFSTTIRR